MNQRKSVLESIADTICALPKSSVQRVAVDGVDGAGKTTFGNELAPLIEVRGRNVIRASADSFHNPRAARYRLGKDSPEGFFLDSYNYASLKKLLLEPLGRDGSLRYKRAAFDHRTDSPVDAPEEVAEPGSILLFDGLFLHRSELRELWDFSIFLDVAFQNSVARMAVRDSSPSDPNDPHNRRYVEGQKIYMSRSEPRAFASLVVDNNDLRNPKIAGGKVAEVLASGDLCLSGIS